MSTGTTVALAVGGAVVIGGVIYFVTRKPGQTLAGGTLKAKPAQQAASVGSAAAILGAGLGGLVTGLFKSSPSAASVIGDGPQPSGRIPPAVNPTNMQINGYATYVGADGSSVVSNDGYDFAF